MDSLPPLRALQICEAVGNSNHLAEAARRLHITPGAISQQIKLLEEALGADLTFKDGKRLKLTTAGQRFHESCSHAFELLREAQAELDRSQNVRNLSDRKSVVQGKSVSVRVDLGGRRNIKK